jgi:hypothetical protein
MKIRPESCLLSLFGVCAEKRNSPIDRQRNRTSLLRRGFSDPEDFYDEILFKTLRKNNSRLFSVNRKNVKNYINLSLEREAQAAQNVQHSNAGCSQKESAGPFLDRRS